VVGNVARCFSVAKQDGCFSSGVEGNCFTCGNFMSVKKKKNTVTPRLSVL